jgi:hypothetical protein
MLQFIFSWLVGVWWCMVELLRCGLGGSTRVKRRQVWRLGCIRRCIVALHFGGAVPGLAAPPNEVVVRLVSLGLGSV